LFCYKANRGQTCHPNELTLAELIQGGINLLEEDTDYIERYKE